VSTRSLGIQLLNFENPHFGRKNRPLLPGINQPAFVTTRCSLVELLDGPSRNYLTQVHRSFAVNMQQATGFNRSEVFIHTHRIPVSRSYFREVAEQFVNST